MTFKTFLIVLFTCAFTTLNSVADSKSKQQKHFPKTLKKKGVYLGMTLEKLKRVAPKAAPISQASEFKIEYTEAGDTAEIVSYTYLLTKTETPQVYSISIAYKTMETVQPLAVALLGAPNYQGEWRIAAKTIKEDFSMGVWTFGHKLVYGATLVDSEWEKGFQN